MPEIYKVAERVKPGDVLILKEDWLLHKYDIDWEISKKIKEEIKNNASINDIRWEISHTKFLYDNIFSYIKLLKGAFPIKEVANKLLNK